LECAASRATAAKAKATEVLQLNARQANEDEMNKTSVTTKDGAFESPSVYLGTRVETRDLKTMKWLSFHRAAALELRLSRLGSRHFSMRVNASSSVAFDAA